MRVLVTGADGMLGSNLVRELLDQNHKVTAFLLPGSKAPTLQGLDIDIHYGNILDLPSLNRAASQCDAIIHTAAITNIWPNRSDIVKKVNIEGTRNVIAAALAAKVQRMVYVGTANSFGFGSKKQPGNETKPYRADTYGLDYMDSKYQAQKLVLQAVKQKALPAVIINPTFMWGPFDAKPGAASMILAIYHGKVPAATTGGRNYVYVKDVTAAIVEALHSGKIGHCYIAGNENLSYEEAFAKIAKVIGVNPPPLKIPAALTKAYGRINNVFAKVTGKPPTISYTMAQISCDEHYFSSEKAINELDMPQTKIEVAIEECFKWLKENGYC